MLYIWEAGQGINLEAKCIKLVIWLELLEWFPDDVSRRKLELSGSIAAVWMWREEIEGKNETISQESQPAFSGPWFWSFPVEIFCFFHTYSIWISWPQGFVLVHWGFRGLNLMSPSSRWVHWWSWGSFGWAFLGFMWVLKRDHPVVRVAGSTHIYIRVLQSVQEKNVVKRCLWWHKTLWSLCIIFQNVHFPWTFWKPLVKALFLDGK